MNHHSSDVIRTLTEQVGKIMKGDYRQAERISELVEKNKEDEALSNLAEAVGMMAVKVEAREFAWKQTVFSVNQLLEYLFGWSGMRS